MPLGSTSPLATHTIHVVYDLYHGRMDFAQVHNSIKPALCQSYQSTFSLPRFIKNSVNILYRPIRMSASLYAVCLVLNTRLQAPGHPSKSVCIPQQENPPPRLLHLFTVQTASLLWPIAMRWALSWQTFMATSHCWALRQTLILSSLAQIPSPKTLIVAPMATNLTHGPASLHVLSTYHAAFHLPLAIFTIPKSPF